MATLRRVVFILSLAVLVLVAAVFAHGNPDPISVDIGFVRLERVSPAVAFAAAVGIGWIFGLASVGVALLRLANERRRLRRELRLAEAEIRSLRSMPLQDAD